MTHITVGGARLSEQARITVRTHVCSKICETVPCVSLSKMSVYPLSVGILHRSSMIVVVVVEWGSFRRCRWDTSPHGSIHLLAVSTIAEAQSTSIITHWLIKEKSRLENVCACAVYSRLPRCDIRISVMHTERNVSFLLMTPVMTVMMMMMMERMFRRSETEEHKKRTKRETVTASSFYAK